MAMCRDLFDPTDPTDLQPEQRQREVAAILAAGLIRIREEQVRAGPPSRVPPGPTRGAKTSLVGAVAPAHSARAVAQSPQRTAHSARAVAQGP